MKTLMFGAAVLCLVGCPEAGTTGTDEGGTPDVTVDLGDVGGEVRSDVPADSADTSDTAPDVTVDTAPDTPDADSSDSADIPDPDVGDTTDVSIDDTDVGDTADSADSSDATDGDAGPTTCTVTADCAAAEDGDLCNGTLICDTATSLCVVDAATIVTCAPGACQAEVACTPATGACDIITAEADGTACDDADACTDADICTAGICGGTAVVCDDSDSCTTDSCDSVTGCQAVALADGRLCDDATVCTNNDVCTAGVCAGTAIVCDDSNPCTDDSCDAANGCESTNTADGTACDDGDACTGTLCMGDCDLCTGGVCGGAAVDCNDDDLCTTDTCDSATGCANTPIACDDNDACTTDACNGTTGTCESTPIADDGACDDGDPCTSDEVCTTGTCGGGVPTVCDDGNDCTTDSCDTAAGGCIATNDLAATCDDGNACTEQACAIITKSATSCEDLGWNAVQRGSPDVCGESDIVSGDCQSGTYAEAEAYCSAAGARLCTMREVANSETRGTGCSYDAELVWTSSPCADGASHWVRLGGPQNGTTTECRAVDAVVAFRCCADTAEAADTATCEATGPSCTGTTGACGSLACDPTLGCTVTDEADPTCEDAIDCTTDSCVDFVGCINVGDDSQCDDSVDCTVDTCEAGAGCTFTPNAEVCPNGTACKPAICDAVTGCGIVDAVAGTTCESANNCSAGSCQAPVGSASDCATLGFDATSDGGPDACAFWAAAGGTCNGSAASAATSCEAAGGRLCTLSEVFSGEVFAGSVCADADLFAWTDTACDDDSTWAFPIDGVGDARCLPNGMEDVAVGCCADANPTALETIVCIDEGTVCDGDGPCVDVACNDVDGCNAEDEGELTTCCGAGGCLNNPCRACVAAVDSFCTDNWDSFCEECANGGDGFSDVCVGLDCSAECGCDVSACDDGDTCTADLCSQTTGCTNEPTDATCACNTNADCDDGIACTLDICDSVAGCMHYTDDSACDNGDACTTHICSSTSGCQVDAEQQVGEVCDDGNACTTSSCQEAHRSAEDCESLGWDPTAAGTATVCAATDINGCSGTITNQEAEAFCAAAGARLCSLTELANDEAAASGSCGYDDQRVWTDTACGPERVWTVGGSAANQAAVGPVCTLRAGSAVVRCCGDVDTTAHRACTATTSPCSTGLACDEDTCDLADGTCGTTTPDCGATNCCVEPDEANLCGTGTYADGRCYVATEAVVELAWGQASALCQLQGGQLATILSSTGNDSATAEVAATCATGTRTAFIGTNDADGNGQWAWESGVISGYSSWESNQPTDGDFGLLLSDSNTWTGVGETFTTDCYVCEFPALGQAGVCGVAGCADGDQCVGADCGNGSCIDGINEFTCQCDTGFDGAACENNLDDCVAGLCVNGTCVDGANSFSCDCEPGYDGFLCDIDIDDCAAAPCLNGGTCVDGVDSFTCDCAAGFDGDTCENNIDDCAAGSCLNGGTCVDGANTFTCDCAPGYDGDTCENNIDDCAAAPCLNGGTCMDGVDSFTCQCATGFDGDTCENNIDDCAAGSCLNGGTCVDGVNSFTCDCASGFVGDTCEITCMTPLTPIGCESNTSGGANCDFWIDGNENSDSDHSCFGQDPATVSCVADGVDGCSDSAGCIRDYWVRFDMGASATVTMQRFLSDWWQKRPNNFELWVSDDIADVPDGGATLVFTGNGESAPWQCVNDEPCVEGVTPEVCCPNGQSDVQSGVTGLYPKWDVAFPAQAEGQYWYFLVRDSYDQSVIQMREVEFEGCFLM